MAFVTVGAENTAPISLYFEDHGSGQPIVLIHGYPLDGSSWERQTRVLVEAGHRVITYDRRGFGRSEKTAAGYDYDTFAKDLDTILDTLDLSDVILVGFSMGTGELARYVKNHGHARVAGLAFLGSLEPQLVQGENNPAGVPADVLNGLKQTAHDDRFAWFTAFFRDFYNLDENLGSRISEEAVRANWNLAAQSAPAAAEGVMPSWLEDFRPDIAAVRESGLPSVIVHGTADNILPIDATGRPFHEAFPEAAYTEIEGAPHGMLWTHADEVNAILLDFVGRVRG